MNVQNENEKSDKKPASKFVQNKYIKRTNYIWCRGR